MATNKTNASTTSTGELYAGVPADLLPILQTRIPPVSQQWARGFWVEPILKRVQEIDALRAREVALPGEIENLTETYSLAHRLVASLTERYDEMGGEVSGVELVAAKDRMHRISTKLGALQREHTGVGGRIDSARAGLTRHIYSDNVRTGVVEEERSFLARQKENERAAERAHAKAAAEAAQEAHRERMEAARRAAHAPASGYLVSVA